ncbi:SpoIIE family protein phosphatase [Geodermatophilus sp. YIM 151500]|uniref:SpoIIE family protein phosphatase n=1 Tax=Geodermatophilus sp. YIM 151500 TaxID=2984531 RepID=UPI0021E4208E|nr:SpoIIE family protein phosphatase [Geodermatophilus sp. YIM 151500]MCV2490609.1 SpoIIE family protein phosphatase [Geodermatophilus sp. YIM 151500]
MATLEPPRVPDRLTDPERLAAAARLLGDRPGSPSYDRLARLAARLVGAPSALVCLVTDAEVVLGSDGLPEIAAADELPLAGSPCAGTVRLGTPLAAEDAAGDERLRDLPAARAGLLRGYLGVPLVAAGGHVVGVLSVFDVVPRVWSDDDVAALRDLAASVVAELELGAANADASSSLDRLDVALEASSVGIWEIDLRTGTFVADQRCAAIFGVEGAVSMPMDRLMAGHVHPDDRATAEAVIREAIAARSQYSVEVRNMRPDGGVRWTVSRGRVLVDPSGEPVRILGTALDVTEARDLSDQRMAAMQRAAAISDVAAEMAHATRIDQLADITLRGAQVLGAESGGIAVRDPLDGRVRVHLGRRLVDVVRSVAEDYELPPGGIEIELDDSLPTQYTVRTGEPVLLPTVESGRERFPRLAEVAGALGLHAIAALPLRVEGRLFGAFVAYWTTDHAFTDEDVELLEGLSAQIALSISRMQAAAERAAAEAATAQVTERLQLLADVGRVFAGASDITAQVEQLAALVVPVLGDWCWVVVTDEQGRLHDLASAHRDPTRRAELEAYVRSMVSVMTDDAGARVVTTTGRPMVLPVIDRERIERALPDPAARESLLRLGASAGVIVPLEARGQTLGALGLFTGPERGRHTVAEIETAVEIGRRAGLALHQARLYAQQRALADALQHSMLTAPPQPDSCEIVVRYVPAAAGVEIGGDWYDAFLQADGATVLAIGDVVGHDTRAAAAMGQVRGLLRGISYSSGAPPAAVLTELDRAVEGLALDTMATALVARLEREPGSAGAVLRWASAGHPPPVVVAPDGQVALLDGAPADLLLGVSPDVPRSDRVTALAPGSTVLLYTDGLVERRDRDIDTGTEELLGLLRGCAELPLTDLCDEVLDSLFLPDAEDDVAVLAVRLDVPRPG